MRFSIHITYFYLESRIAYINRIIQETNKYDHSADIYIHTNNFDLSKSLTSLTAIETIAARGNP